MVSAVPVRHRRAILTELLDRLDSAIPTLAGHFRNASLPKRRYAVLVACQFAVREVGLVGPEVTEALDALQGEAVAGDSLRARLNRLTSELDGEYYRLTEGDSEEQLESERLFKKARAAAA